MSPSKKNLPVKGLCGRCLQTRDKVSHVGIFDPALWAAAPLSFSLVKSHPPPHPPPFLCQRAVQYPILYTDSVWLGGGWGVLSPETIFCRSFTLCIWPDSEPTKLLDHPKQKPRREGGLRQINTCRKVSLQVHFFRWRHFAFVSI